MLEVKPNKEILKIKNKMYMGFSGRQIAFIMAGIVAGSILFFLLPVHELVRTAVVVVVGLFSVAGFFEINGMSMFRFVKAVRDTNRLRKNPLIPAEKEVEAYANRFGRKGRHCQNEAAQDGTGAYTD